MKVIRTKRLSSPRRPLELSGNRLAFFCLFGFIATLGHQVPLVALPTNWAAWPNLSDLFGFALVFIVFCSRKNRPNPLSCKVGKFMLLMLIFHIFNFTLVTITFNSTIVGLKYGGFSIFLMAKYLVIYMAVIRIEIDEQRLLALYTAAMLAFLWLTLTLLCERFGLLELNSFVVHLPHSSAGKWSPGINSTAARSHGETSATILVLSAVAIGASQHRFSRITFMLVVGIGVPAVFLSGSRQGLVRMITFLLAIYLKESKKGLVALSALSLTLLVGLSIFGSMFSTRHDSTDYYVKRQNVLVEDPLTNEGLSGRPNIWRTFFQSLIKHPERFFIGYGIGNFAEVSSNDAHNMFLKFIQDGGIVQLIFFSYCWMQIFKLLWSRRTQVWSNVAMSIAMLTSVMTSTIFYPSLASGWFLGAYFVAIHLFFSYDDFRMNQTMRVH